MTHLPKEHEIDPEISAISVVYGALKNLDAGAQKRVLKYVSGKLSVTFDDNAFIASASETGQDNHDDFQPPNRDKEIPSESDGADQAGINAIALKWIQRNDFSMKDIANIFSIGGDEIDLIAKAIPGDSKRQRLKNVLLLKGVAAYLSGGAPRVPHDQLKETCLHYDAFDATNFAAYMKDFSSEVTGTKLAGYTLNQRGLAAASELIKTMLATNVQLKK